MSVKQVKPQSKNLTK